MTTQKDRTETADAPAASINPGDTTIAEEIGAPAEGKSRITILTIRARGKGATGMTMTMQDGAGKAGATKMKTAAGASVPKAMNAAEECSRTGEDTMTPVMKAATTETVMSNIRAGETRKEDMKDKEDMNATDTKGTGMLHLPATTGTMMATEEAVVPMATVMRKEEAVILPGETEAMPPAMKTTTRAGSPRVTKMTTAGVDIPATRTMTEDVQPRADMKVPPAAADVHQGVLLPETAAAAEAAHALQEAGPHQEETGAVS